MEKENAKLRKELERQKGFLVDAEILNGQITTIKFALREQLAEVEGNIEELKAENKRYRGLEKSRHIAIYAPNSFCEMEGCGYGNRHCDKWMLSIGTPGYEWKYKVFYYDSFGELAKSLLKEKSP